MNNIIKIFACLLFLFINTAGCSHYLTKEQSEALVEILEILNKTIVETEAIMNKNPDPTSPYKELSEKLKTIQDNISRIREGKEPYSAEIMSKYSNEIIGIQMNIQNPVNRVLGVDVFFAPGRYKISDFSAEGKEVLDSFAADILELQAKKLRNLFPEKELAIVIKAIGYADEMPLSQWFAQELEKDINAVIPGDPVEKRKMLNRELSFRRAQSIAEYVRDHVQEMLKMLTIDNIKIDPPVIIGLGEIFPYADNNIDPPYMPRDKRRRICKIHGNVFVISQ
ncbi:OmpA-like domain-containing protein [Desulfonema limicola]|uniref:OmpA-like domain-containing protein n=1 Tax=Desulfonema limicola TaxID=45656 RepID=A0A975GIW5_9BACT|nr:hypothetical protein [Desulfonema limicola]QTA83010.1 OmpA-like domain-containing protein [Desulfonema limicola]